MLKPVACFLLIVLLAGCSSMPSATPALDSGIEGQTWVGPTCPVVREGEECADKPYQAELTVKDPAGREIVRFQTNEQGEFRVPLAPGEYVLYPESPGRFPVAGDVPFTVRPGQFTRLIVTYDSGIR
jgi:hypothetical protein